VTQDVALPIDRGIRVVREGLEIGGRVVPLLVGSVHYWRLDPRDWRQCLIATKELGLRYVDTYIPWGVHEVAPGKLELGETDPSRDVGAFIKLAGELGLYVIARPGPHINAELTFFGIPERVVWDPACQARSARRNPVVLPMLPQAFPVPSYASEVFLDETARYFRGLSKALVPLLYPAGPIVMVQLDNEGAMYFRDGVYDQDYHPDAITLYRTFLREKYKTLAELGDAYGFDATSENAPRFGDIEPPTHFDAKSAAELARHVDWAEFQEHLLARAMFRFADALRDAGIDGVPRSHNFPPGQESTPLNAARVRGAIDIVGYDYYNKASASTRLIISRRTSELAVRCDALSVPAFACEMGAGFPPFFPPLAERDSVFTALAALAYGLRGYNLYMAVERDRWVGAPIDPHGRERPFALFWRKLSGALERVSFFGLRRRTPVRILTPRNERRLARVTHAFGPVSGAFFSVAGAGAKESCFEDDFGLGFAPAVEADNFTRLLESALEARGVPFAHVGGEDRDVSIEGARWVCCITSGGLSPTLFGRLAEAAAAGALVTMGPVLPELGGARRQLKMPLSLAALRPSGAPGASFAAVPVLCPSDPAGMEALVAEAIECLDLPTYSVDHDGVYATIHEDQDGRPKVLFLLNPTSLDVSVRVTVQVDVGAPPLTEAVDLLKDETFRIRDAALEIRVKPKTVRMLALG